MDNYCYCSTTDVALRLLLLLLLPLGCSAQNPSGTGCPEGHEGLFEDPTSCNHFYECRIVGGNQTVFRHQCARNTPYFSATQFGNGRCSREYNRASAACQNLLGGDGGASLNPITIFPPNTASYEAGSFLCPRFLICNRTSLNGLYGDPKSCSRYYLCLDYTAYLIPCPPGMQFSEITRYCDYSYRVGCDFQERERQRYLCSSGISDLRDSHSVRLLMTSLLASSAIVPLLWTSALG